MAKKLLLVLGCIVLIVILTEVIALVKLKLSVKNYASFWQKYPEQGDFTLVVLGDSAAQAIGASQPMKGYVGLLSRSIEQKTGKSVRIVNISFTGARVSYLVENLLPKISSYKPDLLIVEIGANDMRQFNEQKFQQDYLALAKQLPKGTIVSNIPFFGGRDKHNGPPLMASKIIANIAKRYSLQLVDLQTQTKQDDSIRNYAADFFHPSNTGYKSWYAAFWKVIEPQL